MTLAASIRAVTAVIALAVAGVSLAQSYPNRPVRIINPFPPGAATDDLARIIAQGLTERWKQPVLVENKPGAAGNIGMDYVAKSAPDGYTFVINGNTMAMVPWLYPNLPFDMRKDFAPVVYIAEMPGVITVTPSFPADSLEALVRYAKANPGKVTYASAGSGTPQHVAAEHFNAVAGIQTLQIPYKGAAATWAAVMSGEVNMTFGAVSSGLPLIQSGRLKALAVGSTKRLALLPNVPTADEAGVPGYEFAFWYAIFAPAGTPKAIINRFYEDTVQILKEPETRNRMLARGIELVGGSPEGLDAALKRDLEHWGKVIKEARITVQ
jgi:tripartite-type tricarboxylate transporter receptor subunit TctC